MKIHKLFILLFIITLSTSCNKKEIVKNIPDTRSIADIILKFQAFNQQKVDGAFIVQSVTFNNQPVSFKNTTQIGGAFYSKTGQTKAGGLVSIGSYTLTSKGANNFYGFDNYLSRDEFFGKKVTFHLSTKLSTNNGGITTNSIDNPGGNQDPPGTDLYIPAPIYVSSSNNNADPSNYISWNPDPLNTNGVVIVAEYNPDLTLNESLSNAGYNSLIRNSISVPDNGNVILSSDFYSAFPSGAKIVLYVGRGNYTIISSGNYNYSVAGYTENTIYVVTKP